MSTKTRKAGRSAAIRRCADWWSRWWERVCEARHTTNSCPAATLDAGPRFSRNHRNASLHQHTAQSTLRLTATTLIRPAAHLTSPQTTLTGPSFISTANLIVCLPANARSNKPQLSDVACPETSPCQMIHVGSPSKRLVAGPRQWPRMLTRLTRLARFASSQPATSTATAPDRGDLFQSKHNHGQTAPRPVPDPAASSKHYE